MKAFVWRTAQLCALVACSGACSSEKGDAAQRLNQPLEGGILQSDTESISRPTVHILTKGGQSRGSGVLLKGNVALLSAHQVIGYDAKQLTVQRGNVDVALAADVLSIVPHETYRKRSKTSPASGVDLALVFLKSPLFPTLNGNIATFTDALPSSVRVESAYYHGPLEDVPLQTDNLAHFDVKPPVLGASTATFFTNPNEPFQQYLKQGDSGSPCFPDTGDKLFGIVSKGNPLGKSLADRFGEFVDVRQQRLWILGSAVTDTEAAVVLDWDLDGTPEAVRLTRHNGKLDLELVASGTGAPVRVPLDLADTPDHVSSFGLGSFDGAQRKLALVGDGALSIVDPATGAATTLGNGYATVLARPLAAHAATDLVAFRADGTADVFLSGVNGLAKRDLASAVQLPLDGDAEDDLAVLDGKSLTFASTEDGARFGSVNIPFAKTSRPLLASGAFRAAPGELVGPHDLVAEENGEVAYCVAGASPACTWLYRPVSADDPRAVGLQVVDFNDDLATDLAVMLDDGTVAYFAGGSASGLTAPATTTVAGVAGDVTADGCVDEADFEVFEESYGYPTATVADLRADFNDDGWVDDLDYIVLLETWNTGALCD